MAKPAPDGGEREPDRAALNRRLRRALAHLLAGEREAGLALYLECFRDGHAAEMPIGRHLEMLDYANRRAEAAALTALTLERGGSLVRAATIGDYESLFARGHVNARMVRDYAIALMRAGAQDRALAMLDPDRLLRIVRIDSALGPPMRDLLLAEANDATYRAADMSVKQMWQIDALEARGGVAPATLAALAAEIERYRADWAASDHPLAAQLPVHTRIKYWGLVSRGDGHNAPHFHHRGWATGVYYPVDMEGAADERAGALCIGPPPQLGAEFPGWPQARIRPEAGMLVLFPSFYTHWTLPLGGPGLRISIAFDLIAAPAPPNGLAMPGDEP